MNAKGKFEVNIEPQSAPQERNGIVMGKLSIDKTYTGPLQGKGEGTMLSARTPVDTSAGYVAMERVDGVLEGRSGSFVLQHSGTMSGGDQHLSVTIVPDSGTGDLKGISGSMKIRIEEGQHWYELAYDLREDSGDSAR